LSIVVRRIRPADYAALGPAFAELSARALEPNPHMAPAAVTAAMELVDAGDIVVIAVWFNDALGSERLAGIWPLRRARDWRSGFAPVLCAPLLPLYEVSSIPVIDRDHADDVMQAMLRHLLSARDLPGTMALSLMPLEGPSHTVLTEACRVTGSRLAAFERWRRPMLIPQTGDTAETYLRRALGSGCKKRMQQFRAIAKHGVVGFQRRRGKAAREALESFLTLESAGWKGKAGTAIASIPTDATYFRTLADRFAESDGLQIDALTLDGAPIAMGLLVESAGTRHFLKIAYDETQSRHSPGRALTIAMLQADFAGIPAAVFDSGAGDGVDAGTYVWGERREMGNVVIGLGRKRPALPEFAAAARQTLRRLRVRLQR
jgi:hypothetical protein